MSCAFPHLIMAKLAPDLVLDHSPDAPHLFAMFQTELVCLVKVSLQQRLMSLVKFRKVHLDQIKDLLRARLWEYLVIPHDTVFISLFVDVPTVRLLEHAAIHLVTEAIGWGGTAEFAAQPVLKSETIENAVIMLYSLADESLHERKREMVGGQDKHLAGLIILGNGARQS